MIWLLAFLVLGASAADDPLRPEMTAQMWRPTVDARTSLWTDDTSWSSGGSFTGRLTFSYMNSPIQYQYDSGEVVDVLGHAIQGNVVLGAAYSRARLALDVPLHLYADGAALPAGTFGLGDLGVDLKINVLERRNWPVGLAVGLRTVGPAVSKVPPPLSDPRAHGELSVIVDRVEGSVLLAANLGLRVMSPPGQRLGDAQMRAFARVSAAYFVTDHTGLSLDLVSYTPQKLPYATGVFAETMVGAWVNLGEAVVLRGGLGTGLGHGVGSPGVRAVASLGYEPSRGAPPSSARP